MSKKSFPEQRPEYPVFGVIIVGLAGGFAIIGLHLAMMDGGGDGMDRPGLAMLMWLGATFLWGSLTERKEIKRWERRRDDWLEDNN